MNEKDSSRRRFLVAGLTAPALLATTTPNASKTPAAALPAVRNVPRLDYRLLGKTGMKVTTMGFGCMITSDPTVIERAADLGVNYFDTARVYQNGNCERMVGAALKGRRNRIFLSSKTGARTKEQALADLDVSLRETGAGYLDIWYLHGKGKPEDLSDELMEAQEIARKAGKIRFAGVSTHDVKAIAPAMVEHKDHFDVMLTTYNFTMAPAISDAIQLAAEAGLGVVAMKVMAGGRKPQRVSPDNEKTRDILQHEGAMVAALRWALRNPHVHTTVPSITDNDQLDENLKAMAAPISPDEERLLDLRLAHIRPFYCNMCNECAGTCAKGLPVADLLRFYMYSENYGQYGLGLENFRQLPAHVRAVRCADCRECTVRCPNGVRIMERLARAQAIFA